MSDKDFVVKNGLIVNTTFTANSTEVHIGNSTVNAVFTLPSNTTTLTLSNSSLTGTLTSANYSGTSANSTLLNNQPGSYYTNATNINAGTLAWAYQAANTVNTTGNFWMTGNLNFTASNVYFGNSTVTPTLFFNTSNVQASTSNGLTVNSSSIIIGNSSVYTVINSLGFSGATNNALYLGGQPASYYTNATNITTGTLPYTVLGNNVVNTTGIFTVANLTVNNTLTVSNGTVSTIANSSGVYAPAGNVKASYIETTGLANLAWANITGNTYIGGNLSVGGILTVTGTTTIINSVSVATKDHTMILASDSINQSAADGSGIKVANLTTSGINYTFASLTYNAAANAWATTIDAVPATNNILNIGSTSLVWANVYSNNLYGTLQTTSQPNITANNANYLIQVPGANFVQNTDSRVLSGNLNFTGANVYYGNSSIPGSVFFGNISVTNTVVNTAAITFVGTGTTVGNVSVSLSGLSTGNSTVTSNSVVRVQNTAGTTTIGANGASIGGNLFSVGTTLYVTSGGNTGHGTSTPNYGFVEIDNPFGTTTANTLYLYQNSATYGVAGNWDNFRFITTGTANTSFQTRQFNVGVSGVGIGSGPPASSRANSDALYVFGNTGFNTNLPGATVDIAGTLNVTQTANHGGPISVNGDISVGWSNGVINQILTSQGASAPYWSANATLNTVNAVTINSNTVNTIIPTSTYTFTGNSTGLVGNVTVSTATANTIVPVAQTGTISMTTSGIVTGTGTNFLALTPGTIISSTNTAGSIFYTIKNISNSTYMTLVQAIPSAYTGSFFAAGLDNRSRFYVPIGAGVLYTGDAVTYTVGTGNTAVGGLTPGSTYYVIWGNSTSFSLSLTPDGQYPISVSSVSPTLQNGHSFSINYSSNIRVGNNAAGAGIIVIGNTTVNATINSTAFTGTANNITAFPLNQSVNTAANVSFNNITSNTWIRMGASGTGSTLYLGSSASQNKNLAFTSVGGTDTLAFNSDQIAVLTVNNATVLTSCNYATYVSLTWNAISGKPTNFVYNDNGTYNINVTGNAGSANTVAWTGVSSKPTNVSYWTNDTYYANATNGYNISGIAAKLGQGGGLSTGMIFNWSGQSGQPSWLWGGNDGTNMYVWNPSNFSVSYATSAGNASTVGGISPSSFIQNGQSGRSLPQLYTTILYDSASSSYYVQPSSTSIFNTVQAGLLRSTGDVVAFYSDRRLKKDIEVIPNALEKLKSIRGVTFKVNDLAKSLGFTDESEQVGVIAQEVEEVLPQVIKHAPFDIGENGESKSGENYKTVQYEKIVPLLIEAIKELQLEIEELKRSK